MELPRLSMSNEALPQTDEFYSIEVPWIESGLRLSLDGELESPYLTAEAVDGP
jgi:hypothetical protein